MNYSLIRINADLIKQEMERKRVKYVDLAWWIDRSPRTVRNALKSGLASPYVAEKMAEKMGLDLHDVILEENND